MKIRSLQSLVLTLAAITGVTLLAAKAVAQDSTTPTTAATQAAPQLSYGVAQVVQLAHANVGEDVIVNYIQNSGNAYGLDANQILYLKQQGVSDRVINTMLNQRSRMPAPVQTAPPPNNPDANGAQIPTPTPAPAVSYVQTAPPQTVYVIPDTQTYNYYASYPYYYPYYGGYYYGGPAVSLSFGWGGYYGGYRGYYGGYHGGYYGGWHGGGGGWHGGGGGHH